MTTEFPFLQGSFPLQLQLKSTHLKRLRQYFTPLFYLINPKYHCILQIVGQFLWGTKCGETFDAGNHLFNADHFHRVGHHESINHCHVRTLRNKGHIWLNHHLATLADSNKIQFGEQRGRREKQEDVTQQICGKRKSQILAFLKLTILMGAQLRSDSDTGVSSLSMT